MTTSAPILNLTNDTSAHFQAWAQGISTALQAVGLVKTADTGQINFTTVVAPTTSSASQGYEIYRFADSLQATQPVFLKIEYGSGGDTATYPALFITVGTGSNGAGTLTNPSSRQQLNVGAFAGNLTAYFSGDGSYVNFCINPAYSAGSGTGVLSFSLDRTRDTTGTATSDGMSYTFNTQNSSTNPAWTTQPYSFVLNVWGSNQNPGIGFPPVLNVARYSYSDGVAISTVPFVIATPLMTTLIAILGYSQTDLATLDRVSVTVSGTAHTYLATGVAGVGTNNGQTSRSLLIRYE